MANNTTAGTLITGTMFTYPVTSKQTGGYFTTGFQKPKPDLSVIDNGDLMEEILKRGLMNVIKGYKKSADIKV